jgi:hypothetical protein
MSSFGSVKSGFLNTEIPPAAHLPNNSISEMSPTA